MAPPATPGPRTVLLVRPDGNEADAAALAALGITTITRPLLRIETIDSDPVRRLADRLAELGDGDWLVVTSPRTWSRWGTTVPDLPARLVAAGHRGVRVATVGAATSASLPALPSGCLATSPGISAEDLLAFLLAKTAGSPGGRRAVLPASEQARAVLADGLRTACWQVHTAAVYRTSMVPELPTDDPALTARVAGIVVRSPSAADAVARLLPTVTGTTVFAVGPITAARCHRHGWRVVELTSTAPATVAEQIAAKLLMPGH